MNESEKHKFMPPQYFTPLKLKLIAFKTQESF